jgi:hypothetical protein
MASSPSALKIKILRIIEILRIMAIFISRMSLVREKFSSYSFGFKKMVAFLLGSSPTLSVVTKG